MINKLKPDSIRKYNSGPKLHVLMERVISILLNNQFIHYFTLNLLLQENINLYLEACWRLGVAKTNIFVCSDLHGRRAMSSVIKHV